MNQLENSVLAEIHGGFAPLIVWIAGAAAAAAYENHFYNIMGDWGNFKEGFVEGFNSVAH